MEEAAGTRTPRRRAVRLGFRRLLPLLRQVVPTERAKSLNVSREGMALCALVARAYGPEKLKRTLGLLLAHPRVAARIIIGFLDREAGFVPPHAVARTEGRTEGSTAR